MNTYLKYQPAVMQFFTFLGLAGACLLLNALITNYFFHDISSVLVDKNASVSPYMVGQFKWAQLLGATISFILPALLFGYFSSPKALPYVGIRRTISPLLIVLSIILLLSVQPLVAWLGHVNSLVNFGKFQKMLQDTEAVYNRALEVFLQMNSPLDLIINLFIMALLPAIGEELFFRGALQKALLRLTNVPAVTILISSAVFALLHGTFFKLIPIFTLGLLLGTVYHFTRNLWYTITIHFLNNAMAVMAVYFSKRNETINKFANDNISAPLYMALISLVIVIGIVYFIRKKSDEVLPEIITNEDNDYIA
jgi:uncharacterized protein